MTFRPFAPAPPPSVLLEPILRAALAEDLGGMGDITGNAVVAPQTRARAAVVARRPARIAGLEVSLATFRLLDPAVEVRIETPDGADVGPGTVLAVVEGPARAILAAERTMLNLLGRLCGIATATRELVEAVRGTSAQIVCTRKTTPGLRALEKWAVRLGGGGNHRYGLDDAVLIKDNHLLAAGGLRPALERATASVGHMVKIEVEVDTLEQLAELLALREAGLRADAVLLDNMDPQRLRQAVSLVSGRLITEASGNISPQTVRAVADTGVDLISVGWLTHSVRNLDIGLDFVPVGETGVAASS